MSFLSNHTFYESTQKVIHGKQHLLKSYKYLLCLESQLLSVLCVLLGLTRLSVYNINE